MHIYYWSLLLGKAKHPNQREWLRYAETGQRNESPPYLTFYMRIICRVHSSRAVLLHYFLRTVEVPCYRRRNEPRMCNGNDEVPAPLWMICDAHSGIPSLIRSFEKVSHPGADDLFSCYINYLRPNKLNSL